MKPTKFKLAPVEAALERKVRRTRASMLVERFWPRLWWPVSVIGLFVLVSLAGLWPLLTAEQHLTTLGAFGAALLVSLVPLVRVQAPSRTEALGRLEWQSGVPHRPASSYEDKLSNGTSSPEGKTLWAAHRRRLGQLIGRLQVRAPEPRVERHDPYALRALIVLGLALGVWFSGDALLDRLSAPFRLAASAGAPGARLDAWITPPTYTSQPAVMLSDGAVDRPADSQLARALSVPEGSVLMVRATGEGHESFTAVSVAADGTETPLAPSTEKIKNAGVVEFRSTLKSPVTIKVREAGAERHAWQLDVTDDRPPEISVLRPAAATVRGALALAYKVSDDYGVISAEAHLKLAKPAQSKPLTLPDGTVIGAFGDPPVRPLRLPRTGREQKQIEGKTTEDLSAHPWAGQPVNLTLAAKDHAGQIGESAVAPIIMPERHFNQPLARALVELRRKLAFSPGLYTEVSRALKALTIAPEIFIDSASVYLGIRTAYYRLENPPTRDNFQSVIDQLWAVALKIEDGSLSDAERALKEAQDRLAEAIENGATPEELKRLMQELRQALNAYMRELAEQAQRNPGDPNQQSQPQQQLSQRDLDRMLDNLEQMAQSGAKDQAQQMLSELRDMMDRLQAGKQAQNGQGQQMMQMMEQFGGLITEQRKLLDDTFGAQRDGRIPKRGKGQKGQNGQGNELGDPGENGEGQGERDWQGLAGELGRRQGELRRQLDQMMEQLRGMGQDGEKALGDARRSMEDAEQALEQGDLGSATQEQSDALDQLRKGARGMTEQMLGGRNGATGSRAGGNDDRDPLNRPVGDPDPGSPGFTTKVPDNIDAQRAREILQELRKRLGESSRPMKELDYIERLLKRN